MDPPDQAPDRHEPPRTRDRVKKWLTKHLIKSSTPSPSRSREPSHTKGSRLWTPHPPLGTTAKPTEGTNQAPIDEGDAIENLNRDEQDALDNPASMPPQLASSTDRPTLDINRERHSSPAYEPPSTGRKFYEAIKTTLRTIERTTDVFTPLKSTAAALLVICDTIDAYGGNREEFERLLKRVDAISSIMESWPTDASQGAEDRFSGLSRTLVDMQNLLMSKVNENRSKLERALLTAQDGQEVLKLTREIELAMEIALFEATA
ncbi:hypothetical protein DFP72DRAFT_1040239, partial [Ephemerocybe angulata]